MEAQKRITLVILRLVNQPSKESGSFDAEIEIPLGLFSSKNISFTYPDSFFSEWLSRNKDHELYNNELNGKIFTIDEILNLLAQNKIPQNVQIDTAYSYKFEFYIEAQVWDYDILNNYMTGRNVVSNGGCDEG